MVLGRTTKATLALGTSSFNNQDLLHILLDNIPDAIYFKDADSRFIMVNRSHAHNMGLENPREALGKTDFNFYDQRYASESREDEQKIIQTGVPLLYKVEKLRAKDGKERWFSVAKIPIRNNKAKIIGIVGISRNITEIKRMEEELKTKAKILDSADDSIFIYDLDGNLCYANEAFYKAHGYGENNPSGSTSEEGCVEIAEISEKKVDELLAKGTVGFECTYLLNDSSVRNVEVRAQIIQSEGRDVVLSISRDITERKRMEEELKKANDKLKKSLGKLKRLQRQLEKSNLLLRESNTDLENYTYVVSHDLKAPLRAIRSFSSFLLEDYLEKIDDAGQEYLNRIRDAANRMDEFIEDLLLLSRVGRKFTEIQKVDLNELLNEIISDFSPSLQKGRIEVLGRFPVLSIQRVWIKQLFANLIGNGLKFNKSETPMVQIFHEDRTDEHLFGVRDNGIGIDEKYHDRIFNLFERLHSNEEYPGTGAGLAICKKIIGNFKGKIWIESAPEKGSTFFFTLPKSLSKKGEKKLV